MELLARYILNAAFGGILTFYLTFLLVTLFKPLIRQPRLLYYLYLFPLIKPFWDLISSSHSNWIFTHGEKILHQLPDSRSLEAFIGYKGIPFGGIKMQLNNGHTFSIGDTLAELIPSSLLILLGGIFFAFTLLSIIRFGYRLYRATEWTQSLLKNATPYIENIFTSKDIKSPLLIGLFKSNILIPESLSKTLSLHELNAIFAHETGHLKWRDNLLNSIIEGIGALFWFIPFGKKMVHQGLIYREIACDYRGDPLYTAHALTKVASSPISMGGIPFLLSEKSAMKRAQWLLQRKRGGFFQAILSFLCFVGVAMFVFPSHFLPF